MACGDQWDHRVGDFPRGVFSGVLTTDNTADWQIVPYGGNGYVSIGDSTPAVTKIVYGCQEETKQREETKQMALYKVYFVHNRDRTITEVNVVANCETNAFMKALKPAGIDPDDIDDYDKHAEHVFDLSDDDE